MQPLSDETIQERLTFLEGWKVKDKKLYRVYHFTDFKEAFAFMTMVAMAAEELNHHPEWYNVYNKVEVYLYTHDANGITEKDFQLAERIESYASYYTSE